MTLSFLTLTLALVLGSGGTVLAGDLKAGRQKALQCQACHGLDGLAKIPGAPHIAGQVEDYLVKRRRRESRGGERSNRCQEQT